MKKLIHFLILTMLFGSLFTFNVKAETYHHDNIRIGQLLHAGDVIENDFQTGYLIITGYTWLLDGNHNLGSNTVHVRTANDGSWVVPRNLYYYGNGGIFKDLWVTPSSTYLGNGIERVYANVSGGTGPYRYYWYICSKSGQAYSDQTGQAGFNEPAEWLVSYFNTDVNYLDIHNIDDIVVVNCLVIDSANDNIADCGCGYFMPNLYYPEGSPAPQDSDDDEETHEPPEPQIPSTLPENTVQVSFGDGDSSFADVKVLNQYLHDTINQRLIADLYAAKLKKRASVIMQKNLHAPYCADAAWKKSSHKIRWNNLNVKKGDNVLIVWYTPSYFGLTPTLKTIQATVVDDGIIEFTVPYMGDMSVMSIVKLI